MKQFPFLLTVVISLAAHAQKQITLDELSSHVGGSVTVKGNIAGVRYLETAKNTSTFINVGGAFPNQKLTVVIWGDVRKKLTYKPEEKPYSQGGVTVSGKVELYKGKPQMVIHDPKQLLIAYDEDVPASPVPPINNKHQ